MADVNVEGEYHGTALRVASYHGYEKIVHILLDHGADVNARGPWGSALKGASEFGKEKVVQILLKYGAKAS